MSFEIPITKKYAKIGLVGFGWFSWLMLAVIWGSTNIAAGIFFILCGISLGTLMPIIQCVNWWLNDDFPIHFRENED